MRRFLPLVVLLASACGAGTTDLTTPEPVRGGPAEVDSLYRVAEQYYRHGKWARAATTLERLVFEFPPGDPRVARTHFLIAESYFASNDHLRAAREFRKVSDETPTDPLAPEALLRAGDAYADLWKRPELDPSYGQTAMAYYQELLNRYPNAPAAARARERLAGLQEKFAVKEYKAAMFYFRYKAWDSAILYFSDILLNYRDTRVAPDAAIRLVETYQTLGYVEEQREKCAFIRQYYPGAEGVDQACPAALTASTP
ncbi:MAG: outer membrane protein assembly factor BamD [Gemmatimonadales bacterium]